MTVNISGQVPAEAQNGMYDIEEEWLGDRTPEPILAIVVIERDGFRFKDDKQERSATMKFKHIEPLLSASAQLTARKLLEDACVQRGGEVYARPEPDTELEGFPGGEAPEDLTPALGDPFDAGDAA